MTETGRCTPSPRMSWTANSRDGPQSEVGRRLYLRLDERMLALRRGGARSLLAPRRRLVHAPGHAPAAHDRPLTMAHWRRGPMDALLHRSDRGSQYTSEAVS